MKTESIVNLKQNIFIISENKVLMDLVTKIKWWHSTIIFVNIWSNAVTIRFESPAEFFPNCSKWWQKSFLRPSLNQLCGWRTPNGDNILSAVAILIGDVQGGLIPEQIWRKIRTIELRIYRSTDRVNNPFAVRKTLISIVCQLFKLFIGIRLFSICGQNCWR